MKILLLEAELFQVDERIIGHTDRRVDGQTDVHTHTHTHDEAIRRCSQFFPTTKNVVIFTQIFNTAHPDGRDV